MRRSRAQHTDIAEIPVKHRGELSGNTVAVVMDNTTSKIRAVKVPYFITENPELLCGNNTVAVFRVKLKQPSETHTD